jgi:hypothetical protein
VRPTFEATTRPGAIHFRTVCSGTPRRVATSSTESGLSDVSLVGGSLNRRCEYKNGGSGRNSRHMQVSAILCFDGRTCSFRFRFSRADVFWDVSKVGLSLSPASPSLSLSPEMKMASLVASNTGQERPRVVRKYHGIVEAAGIEPTAFLNNPRRTRHLRQATQSGM